MYKKGFSLIELLVAIAIVSILFFIIASTFYDKFKSKAYLEQDGMIYAKNCMGDLVAYCINHPNGAIGPNVSFSCQNRHSLYGDISFKFSDSNCNGDTLPEGFTLKVTSTASKYYEIVCTYENNGFHCSIKPKSE
jgi:prepilin-type N-terminal cleavage/methylation domain-containing protein